MIVGTNDITQLGKTSCVIVSDRKIKVTIVASILEFLDGYYSAERNPSSLSLNN